MHPFLVHPQHLETLEGIRDVLQRLRTLSRSVSEDEESDRLLGDLLRHLDEMFLVVVVGEVKSGKSTLINALLGQAVCAVGPTPVTDRITILRHGEEAEDENGEGGVRVLSLPTPALEGLAIVDTPGTNSLVRWHQELTESFLPRSDLVLFVTSCDRPYSASENDFLHLIRDRWRRKIVFVLAKTDIKEAGEVDEIAAYVRRCAFEELGIEPDILPVSPREAWHARQENDDERLARSGFPELRQRVLEALGEDEKAKLRLRGPVDAGQALAESVRRRLRKAREVLEADSRTLRDLEAQTDHRRRDLRTSIRRALDRVSEIFASLRLRGEASLASRLRLSGLLSRTKAEARFREEVVGELDDRLAGVMEDAASDVIDASRRWFEDTLDTFERSLASEHHPDGVVGRPVTRFESAREDVLREVRERANEQLRGFDAESRVRELLASASRNAGISAAGVGAGVLAAGILGLMASLWWTVLAIPVAGAGLAYLGWRKSRLSREWATQVATLEGRCREGLGDELERALDRVAEQVRRIYGPYLAFYEAERETIASREAELEGIETELRGLRK